MSGSYVTLPDGWERTDPGGFGPFVTRERFRSPDGAVVEWSSREHRKQAGRLDNIMLVNLGTAVGGVCFLVGALFLLPERTHVPATTLH